jgi:hypothetical protein
MQMFENLTREERQSFLLKFVDNVEALSRKTSEQRHHNLKEKGYTDEEIKSIEGEAWVMIMETVRDLGQ